MSRSKPESTRLFFALVPDVPTRRQLERRKRALGLSGRPVPPERLHATLAFLGQQPASRIGELRQIAESVPFTPTTIRLDCVGGFEQAGVAWIGTSSLPDALREFRARLAGRLADQKFALDGKPWIFHVTLYRDLRTPYPRMTIDPVGWAVSQFVLMESVSDATGLCYRERGRWPEGPHSAQRERA